MIRWSRLGWVIAACVIVVLVGVAAYLWMRAPSRPATAAAPPPPEVGVGRVAGFRVVEIRAQVSGVLLKREYLEGAVVDVGQVLFRIDPRTYEAALARATAQAAQAKAALIQAEENFKRQEGLAAQRVATQKAYEDAVAGRDQARAAVLSTEADVLTAKL